MPDDRQGGATAGAVPQGARRPPEDTRAETGPGSGEAPGYRAARPRHIPPQGWGHVLRRTGRRVMGERLPLLSAGIAFFAILSIAPVLVTALSVYGAVTTPDEAMAQVSRTADVLPGQLQEVVADQLTSITAASAGVQTVRGLTALVIALWTATAAMTYLMEALSVVYHEEKTRGFGRRLAVAFAFVLGGALLLGAVITAAGLVTAGAAGASGAVREVVQGLVWAALAVLMVVVLALLYRYAPDRRQARWRWISGGSVLATALWLVASFGLFAYVRGLGTYETTYGSLAGVAISMFWIWWTVLLVLVGGAVNAEAERQTAEDSTVGPERPLGSRDAVVADSAPPYEEDDDA